LKTTAQTLSELENDIKSKLKLQGNTKFDLEFFRKGKYFILDDMEDLEDGMTIKVSISTQLQSQSDSNLSSLASIEYYPLKNWKDISLSQGPNSEFRVEIDPDEIPNKIKTQIGEMMKEFSKLETCTHSKTTPSNFVFQVEFIIKKRAEKVFDQIVELLES